MSQQARVMARQLACPIAAALFFFVVVWRQGPLAASGDDLGTLLYALFGLATAPDTLLTFLPISSHRQFSARVAAVFGEDDVIRVFGFVLLFDALTGWGKWIVWTRW